ncbi:MAG TPA: glycosyltransferase, partial [Elusimicrobiota bacterium]|nr:glycosyltransferase [Elusimicrobiota bacterium]
MITSLEGGGTENFLYQVLQRSPRDYRHRVLFLKKDGVNGNRIRGLGIPVEGALGVAGVWSALRRDRPAILHTCLYQGNQWGRLLGHRAGVPAVLSSQRAMDHWQKPWHRWLDHWTLPLCDAVLVNSLAVETLIQRRRGSRPKPLVVPIYNGVDPERLVAQDRWIARQKYGIRMDALIAGSLLRLHREKGADRIPAFAESLLTARPDMHFLIGGTGPLEAELKRQTANKPWSGRL